MINKILILFMLMTTGVFAEPIFYYKANLQSERVLPDGKRIRFDIPDLISGITIDYNKNNKPVRVSWSGPRGLNELIITVDKATTFYIPSKLFNTQFVMIGINKSKDIINKGQWNFINVKWYGFITTDKIKGDLSNVKFDNKEVQGYE